MLLEDAPDKIVKFNNYCLHYNLVSTGVYDRLQQIKNPFGSDYRPYIIAGLISFDMGRMMGKGLEEKFDVEKKGFASKLQKKLEAIEPYIKPFVDKTIVDFQLKEDSTNIRNAYDILSKGGKGGLHNQGKDFHVGATKILHFINPNFFPIIDSNAAKTFKWLYGFPYKKSTQPGYSSYMYLRSMVKAKEIISNYGLKKFRTLEPDTPTMRIFDKLTFAYGNGWKSRK